MSSKNRRRARPMAVLTSVVIAALVGSASLAVSGVSADESAAQRAAAEIQAARDRADRAASAMFDAESRLDSLSIEEQELAIQVVELEAVASQLQVDVEELAVQRFVSGARGIPLLSGLGGPTEQAQMDVLLAIATDTSQAKLDEYDAVATELADKRRRLGRAKSATEQAIEDYASAKVQAESDLKRLQEIEAERLENERVKAILEAQRQAALAEAAARGGGNGGASFLDNGVYMDRSIVCPIRGSAACGDTWGAPRSGGRRHEGVDMLASTGTPLVAVASGRLRQSVFSLGGISSHIYANNGNTYFYAHLSSWEGPSRTVQQGEVIGYVGDTGNASGTPHLHFEIRPNGGRAINPYPAVRAAC
ncbi:MAG: peptidoglycan DD-metalloendopeptidase family protein [Ilumatobacteraceae bacterium]